MKRLILGIFLIAPLAYGDQMPPRCADGDLNPHAPIATKQFDFLVGDFEVTLHAWRNNAWTPPRPTKARWNGWYGLEGMAIVDEWFDPDPAANPKGGRGINVRMFDEKEQQWKMMWMHTTNKSTQDLRAKMIDGVLTMWQVHPERPNFRAEFEVIDENRWARVSFVPGEKEDEWLPQFRLEATRIACD